MAKKLFIAEKPSVAQEFAKALKYQMSRRDGYLESEEAIVTWCVGHLVTMSYPEVYDIKYKKWSVDTLPFIPETFKYEVISGVKKQFDIVSSLLNRPDVDTIYVCTDSGREGEYIYRLVEQEANIHGKKRRRVWIDSQTEEEILRGVREAKDLSEYDNLANGISVSAAVQLYRMGAGGCLFCIDSFSCSLAADQCNFLFRNKLIEHPHCIAAAADTCQNSCRKLSFLFQNLCLCLPSDDRLEIPHDRRKRMRSHDRAQYIVGVRYAVCPLTHRLVYCIL